MTKKDGFEERVWKSLDERVKNRLALAGYSDKRGHEVFDSRSELKTYLQDREAWDRIGLTRGRKNRLTHEGLNFVESMAVYLVNVYDTMDGGRRGKQKRPSVGLESALKAVDRFYEKCGIETSKKGLNLSAGKKLDLICAIGRRPEKIQENIDYVLRVQQALGQQVYAFTRSVSMRRVYAVVTVDGLLIPSAKGKDIRLYAAVTRSDGSPSRIRTWVTAKEHTVDKTIKKDPPAKTAGRGKTPKGIELRLEP